MDIVLRSAKPGDAKEMAHWFDDLTELAHWGGPDVRFPLSEDQMARWIAESADERPRLCLTAVDGRDRPVGHVQYLREPKRRWARLGRFAVARELRGRGFGRRLFDRAVAHAFNALDVDHLVLAVARENILAHDMYERSGFRREAVETSVRRADGVAYLVDIMGLERDAWTKRSGAPAGATKVA